MLSNTTSPDSIGKSPLPGKNLIVLFVLFTVFQTVTAQEIGSIRKSINISFPEKIQKLVLDPLPAGTYSIGSGGYFPTIDSAFKKLSFDGISGAVTLELIDTLYTAPTNDFGFLLNGPIQGAGPTSRVTIKPAANKNVVIEGSGGAAVSFVNTSFFTIDGVALTGSTTLWFHTYNNAPYYSDGLDFINNSDHNIIQNITCISENFTTSAGIGLWSTVSTTSDSNLIQNNFIKKGAIGIYLQALDYQNKCIGNIIKQNTVGSKTDSLIGWGIIPVYSTNTIIEENIISHLTLSVPDKAGNYSTFGICSSLSAETVIRNNLVYNVQTNSGTLAAGISLFGTSGSTGTSNQVYNNMIYNIQSSSAHTDSRVGGIYLIDQSQPKIYYNSVNLSGTGANHQGSAALYLDGSGNSGIDIRNNILLNTRDESPYCASSIYNYTDANMTSDNNDLFYETNQYNCLVRIGDIKFDSLAYWQAMGMDVHSVTEAPSFIEPFLHINESIATVLESNAAPISGIDTDFDGNPRNSATPDIGADEFAGTVGVEDETTVPAEYSLSQNYPNPFNPSTHFGFRISDFGFVSLKVFDVLGNEVAALVNEEKPAGTYEITWNAENLSSGVYFYRLTAGKFSAVRKMLLIK